MFYHKVFVNYCVDSNGVIYGPRGVVNPFLHRTGYLVFTARENGKQKQFRAHRFIMECLSGQSDLVVNHRDGDKTNNHPSNLEFVTSQQNTCHAYKIGLMKGKSGEENSGAKLTNNQAICLIKDILAGLGNRELGDKYGLHPNYISLIRSRRRWVSLWESLEGSETIR